MKVLILLHSTTGNTKLVTRYARTVIEARGHSCSIHDVGRNPDTIDLEGVDLLGLSCPTMYFRPTYVMERVVARLPVAERKMPAFLLATCGGDPGAHFQLLSEQLAHKETAVLGAHFVPMTNNWPIHRNVVSPFAPAEPVIEQLLKHRPKARGSMAFLWPDIQGVSKKAPQALKTFVETMLNKADSGRSSDYVWAPEPSELPHGPAATSIAGRNLDVFKMRKSTNITIDRELCMRCGTCINICPSECLTRDDERSIPRVGDNCTGCWACFNHCPHGAIGGVAAPPGAPRYTGPTKAMRDIFRNAE